MTPQEFVQREITEGRLTFTEIVELVKAFQRTHGLGVDGKPGESTQKVLDRILEPRESATLARKVEAFLHCPMPVLADGRKAVITSAFRPKERPNHDGLDYFYVWKPGDKPDFVGDKGAAGRTKNGTPKWVVPYDVCAIAAADGVVSLAGNSPTGYRLWIDHGNGWRSGYFHLLDLRVSVGQHVATGKFLGLVGDNPRDNDGRHLHFGVSPVARYAPVDPVPLMVRDSR